MRNFIEKLLIIIFCLTNTYIAHKTNDLVFFFLVSMIISFSLDLTKSKRIKIIIYIIFLGLCFYENFFIYYLPLILYNMYLDFSLYFLLAIPLFSINFSISNLFISFCSIYFAIMTNRFNVFFNKNKIIRDELKEDAIYLKKYTENLNVDKEKDIHIAILTERNRIAREIHDSIGHSISSSILQVEALKVSVPNDSIVQGLDTLQDTLSTGMDDIRDSIHNLYNESLDLKRRIEEICDEVSSLDIDLKYNLEGPLIYDFKFDILSIIRESITNCLKHSNATKLYISLLTQPKFYTIIIKDNGSNFSQSENISNKGIGLLSMDEVARKHGGFLNYEFNEGFKIHITLMKG